MGVKFAAFLVACTLDEHFPIVWLVHLDIFCCLLSLRILYIRCDCIHSIHIHLLNSAQNPLSVTLKPTGSFQVRVPIFVYNPQETSFYQYNTYTLILSASTKGIISYSQLLYPFYLWLNATVRFEARSFMPKLPWHFSIHLLRQLFHADRQPQFAILLRPLGGGASTSTPDSDSLDRRYVCIYHHKCIIIHRNWSAVGEFMNNQSQCPFRQ
jgi:hypothetical protein